MPGTHPGPYGPPLPWTCDAYCGGQPTKRVAKAKAGRPKRWLSQWPRLTAASLAARRVSKPRGAAGAWKVQAKGADQMAVDGLDDLTPAAVLATGRGPPAGPDSPWAWVRAAP